MRKNQQKQHMPVRRKPRRRRKKSLLAPVLLFIFILILLGFSIYGIYHFVQREILADSLQKIPTVRREAMQKFSKSLIITSDAKRPLRNAEKSADVKSLIAYLNELPEANATRPERIDKLADKAIQSADDGAFLQALHELIDAYDSSHTALVTKEEYLTLCEKIGYGFFTEDSPYGKYITDSRVQKRYDTLKGRQITSKKPSMTLSANGSVALFSDLSFKEEDLARDEKIIQELFNKAKKANELVLDLRNTNGTCDAYWISLLIPHVTDVPASVSATVLYPREFDEYMEYFALSEKEDAFDLQDDRGKIPPLDTTLALDNLSFSKKMTFSVPAGDKEKNQTLTLLIDETTGFAAEAFAHLIKENRLGTLVGKKTSGNAFKLPTPVKMLEHSALLVAMNFDVVVDREERGFEKDQAVRADMTIEEWKSGRK